MSSLVIKGSSNSTFKLISNSNVNYKSIIINNNKTIDFINYNSNGFIGIGTEIPSERLELKNGQLKLSSNDTSISSIILNNNNFSFYNSNNNIISLFGLNNNHYYYNSSNQNSNYLYLLTSNDINGYYFNGEFLINEIRPENDIWHRSIDNNHRFYFSNNSSTIFKSPNGFKWNNNDNQEIAYLSNNGFFGIGITNPKTTLHVSSISFNQYPLKISTVSNNDTGSFIAFNTSNVEWCKCAIGHIKTGDYDTGDLIFLNRNTPDNLNANFNDDEIMRIKNNGNIGIGIKNPTANLHINNSNINQTVLLKISDGINSNGLLLFKSSNNNSYLVNNENNDLFIGVNNNDDISNQNRKLGIRIDNSNNLNFNNNINFDSYSNSEFSISVKNNMGFINHKTSLLFYENNNNNHNNSNLINIGRDIGWGITDTYIHSKLGIGTNPIEKLHVQGIIASINKETSNFIRIFNENSTAFIDSGSYENGLVFRINKNNSNYGISNFNENFNEVMRIKSNGNIGIGNSTPITTLNTDTNVCIGNSLSLNNAGFLILSRNNGNTFQRNFKMGYGDLNFMTFGDFGSNNNPITWKQQIRIHWNCPNNTFLIYENGDANLYGRLYQASDIKIKTNIKTIENALEKVNKLNGIHYSFITNDNDNDNNHIGLIAQEVEKIIPEVVHYNSETDLKSVAYGNLTPLLINAIKELTKKINVLEEKLKIYE